MYYSNDDHRDVFLHNPYVDELIDSDDVVGSSVNRENIYEPALHWPNTLYDSGASRVIAEMLHVSLESEVPTLFLAEDERFRAASELSHLQRPVIAVHGSSTFEYKEWYPERWTDLIARNPNCTFVQLGLSHEDAIEGCIDLRGKSLRQTFAIISECDALVGCP